MLVPDLVKKVDLVPRQKEGSRNGVDGSISPPLYIRKVSGLSLDKGRGENINNALRSRIPLSGRGS